MADRQAVVHGGCLDREGGKQIGRLRGAYGEIHILAQINALAGDEGWRWGKSRGVWGSSQVKRLLHQ